MGRAIVRRLLELVVTVTLVIAATTGSATSITGIHQVEAGEAPRFDIRTDQPATYEAYSMPQVLRYVVDLHNVEPGMASNLTKLDTPSVKRVLLQQKNLNGLSLTRVIFDLSREMAGRVVVDEGGRRLLVVFTPPANKSPLMSTANPSAYQALPMPSPTATVANQLPPLKKKGVAPVVPERPVVQSQLTSAALTAEIVAAPPPVPLSTAQGAPVAIAVATNQGKPRVEAVKVESDGVLVVISGNFSDFKSFTLKAPGRLIIDIPKGSTSLGKPVPINRFGVRAVRLGLEPQRLRIVLDAGGDTIAVHEILRVDNGLKIVFPHKK